jgi:hypothetical protein
VLARAALGVLGDAVSFYLGGLGLVSARSKTHFLAFELVANYESLDVYGLEFSVSC